jgi:hypothetical protein
MSGSQPPAKSLRMWPLWSTVADGSRVLSGFRSIKARCPNLRVQKSSSLAGSGMDAMEIGGGNHIRIFVSPAIHV